MLLDPREKYWYVIYTKAKNEKKVAELLTQSDIEAYCPTKKVTRQWKDRKKVIDQPLFTSYCFVYVNEFQRIQVLNTMGVSRFVFWCGKPAIVKSEEIEIIKRWLNEYDNEAIQIEEYKKNDTVTLLSGSFMDHSAHIISKNGNQLVLILRDLGFRIVVNTNQILLKKAV